MKRLLMSLIFLSSIFALASSSFSGTDLTKLWKEYDSASLADRPKKQIEILDQIGKIASSRHLPYDYYKYLKLNRQLNVRIDWKKRDSLNTDFNDKVKLFDEPVLTYVTSLYPRSASTFIHDNESRLRNSVNSAFYSEFSLSEKERKCIINDYEFVVWSNRQIDEDLFIKTLKERFSEESVATYHTSQSIRKEYHQLVNSSDSSESKFLKLYDKLLAFRKTCSKIKGIDAELVACWSLEDIESELTRKEISLFASDGIAYVSFRNLDRADIRVRKGDEVIHMGTVRNHKRSFYLKDTVRYELPSLDDGEYSISISAGPDCEETVVYKKTTISSSIRIDAGGYSLFAADCYSGKPLENVNVYLYKNDKLVETLAGFSSSDGYAYLPSSFQKRISAIKDLYKYKIICGGRTASGMTRLSQELSLPYPNLEKRTSEICSMIFLDRTLCKPGGTLQFKVLAYRRDEQLLTNAASNEDVVISIIDAQGRIVQTTSMKTSEFGTVAGRFDIPSDVRNGIWLVSAKVSDGSVAQKEFRVEEMVLPSFELTFDPYRQIALFGDSVPVSGVVKGYSGHSPSSAAITYTVTRFDRAIAGGTLKPDAKGRFYFTFPAEYEKGIFLDNYQVTVKVVDQTGETLEFSTSRRACESISISAQLSNPADGEFRLKGDGTQYGQPQLLTTQFAEISIESQFGSIPVGYRLSRNGVTVRTGSCKAGDVLEIDMSSMPQGIYEFDANGSKNGKTCSAHLSLLKISPDAKSVDMDVEHFFMPLDGDVPAFKMGTTTAPMWACVSLYGPGNILLANRLVYLGGEKGSESSVADVRFDKIGPYPEQMTVTVLYFRDCTECEWQWRYKGPVRDTEIPVTFERFHDKASPSSEYLFTVRTAPQVEAVVTVYDKAVEAMSPNPYSRIEHPTINAPSIPSYTVAASVRSSYPVMLTKSRAMALSENGALVYDYAVETADVNYEMASDGIADTDVKVRTDFSTALLFEPFLHSDSNGLMDFRVKTSDKTSTFVVQLFAHDKTINTGVLKGEMLVSVPVEVSVQEPRFLYEGDRYVLAAKLSNTLESSVSGNVRIDLFDGDDYKSAPLIGSVNVPATIGAGRAQDFEKEITVPEDVRILGVKISFASDESGQASDAVFVKIPVYPARQKITEAHSSVLLDGADRDALIAELRSLFVNGSGEEAVIDEVSISKMLEEALPEQIDTTMTDAVSLSGMLMAALKTEAFRPGSDFSEEKSRLAARLEACHNADGGYGWLPQMTSSAIVTAVVLERLSGTEWAAGLADAVKYLDNAFVSKINEKYWWSGISLEQYLYVRSMYPQVEFSPADATSKDIKAFRRDAKSFLAPRCDRGLQGQILAKTRRALALRALSASESGRALAKSFGIRLSTSSRIGKSLEKDIISIREYMVDHRSGGAYCPNAVMPWRGLLESELYAHTLLHRLLGDDRISIWMMVQKATQQWSSDPAYVDALAEVFSSSETILATKVVKAVAESDMPFGQIRESGNGMKISRSYSVEMKQADGSVSYLELKEGDLLKVGDKVIVTYNIWNEENRSFVRLTANRPASLRPENQYSGSYGWRPRTGSIGIWFIPQGYRNVKAEATEFWFDVYPEDNTSITETFYVTQKGCFSTPALVIESLYAPHYRACDSPSTLSSN